MSLLVGIALACLEDEFPWSPAAFAAETALWLATSRIDPKTNRSLF